MTKSEKINLAATIAGPVILALLMAWLNWSFDAKLQIDRDESDKFNAANFVAKPWFEKSHDELMTKLDTLTKSLNALQNHVSMLDGEMPAIKAPGPYYGHGAEQQMEKIQTEPETTEPKGN